MARSFLAKVKLIPKDTLLYGNCIGMNEDSLYNDICLRRSVCLWTDLNLEKKCISAYHEKLNIEVINRAIPGNPNIVMPQLMEDIVLMQKSNTWRYCVYLFY